MPIDPTLPVAQAPMTVDQRLWMTTTLHEYARTVMRSRIATLHTAAALNQQKLRGRPGSYLLAGTPSPPVRDEQVGTWHLRVTDVTTPERMEVDVKAVKDAHPHEYEAARTDLRMWNVNQLGLTVSCPGCGSAVPVYAKTLARYGVCAACGQVHPWVADLEREEVTDIPAQAGRFVNSTLLRREANKAITRLRGELVVMGRAGYHDLSRSGDGKGGPSPWVTQDPASGLVVRGGPKVGWWWSRTAFEEANPGLLEVYRTRKVLETTSRRVGLVAVYDGFTEGVEDEGE